MSENLSVRLQELLEKARDYVMTPAEREAQRRSWAYGNAKMSNPNVTKAMVDQAAEEYETKRTVREPSPSPCCECGEVGYEIDWIPETRKRMQDLGVCLHCLHWLEVYAEKDLHVVIDGFAYRPKADDPRLRAITGGWGLGGGGTTVRFVLKDGTLLQCCNVWHRGDVPEHFRERLPDDARFATSEEREQLDWTRAITHLPRTT